MSTSTAGRGRGDRQVATSDAPVVAAVRAAGAIVIGKTRTDELGDVRAQLRATGRLTRLRGPVNTSGLVAMSVPSGTDEADHPIGVQLVATRMRVLDDAARRFSTP